jgi:hypothetical protein
LNDITSVDSPSATEVMKPPDQVISMSIRLRAGVTLSAIMGLFLIAIGGMIIVKVVQAPPTAPDGVLLFAVREIFLGALCLSLIIFREWRSLFFLLGLATLLPLADSAALYFYGKHPLGAVLASNIPFELPLILCCALMAPAVRRQT